MWFINSDSSIQPCNPGGILTWAFIVKERDGTLVHQDYGISKRRKDTTNNQGEYMAVVAAMHWLYKLPKEEHRHIIFRSDSQLVVNHCSGKWRCKDPLLLKYFNLIQEVRSIYSYDVTFMHVPRTKNFEADDLSRVPYEDPEIQKELETMKKEIFRETWKNDDLSF
jgi:ribonuclease HI